MIQRRAKAAGIKTKIGNHSWRATGITAYMKNGGLLEHAQQLANHSSPRTTKLYDRRQDEISLDEVEQVVIRYKLGVAEHRLLTQAAEQKLQIPSRRQVV